MYSRLRYVEHSASCTQPVDPFNALMCTVGGPLKTLGRESGWLSLNMFDIIVRVGWTRATGGVLDTIGAVVF